jgi:hypothetical protein
MISINKYFLLGTIERKIICCSFKIPGFFELDFDRKKGLLLKEWYLTGRFEATEIMFSFKNSLITCTNLSLQSLSFQDLKGTSKYRNSVKAWMRYFKEILV